MKWVVDSNVAIVANGKAQQVSAVCQICCIEFLQYAISPKSPDVIALDNNGAIFDEYKKHLSFAGQPGVGDIFFKFIHDQMYSKNKIKLFVINPVNDESVGYRELPPNNLDQSDRKFLAVACVAKANIANATDTDWEQQKALVTSLGVTVKQLCKGQ